MFVGVELPTVVWAILIGSVIKRLNPPGSSIGLVIGKLSSIIMS